MKIEKNGLSILRLEVGIVQTNCYIVGASSNQTCVIVDPGGEENRIIRSLEDAGLKPEAILLTHGHFDHIMGIEAIRKKYGAKVYAHKEEKELLGKREWNATGVTGSPYECTPDVLLEDGDVISLSGMDVTVLHTPGHTKGGACYYLKDYGLLFSGDTLFFESVGRTDLATGDEKRLISSIRDVLFRLDDGTMVYPGHGESTDMGHEKKHNPYVTV